MVNNCNYLHKCSYFHPSLADSGTADSGKDKLIGMRLVSWLLCLLKRQITFLYSGVYISRISFNGRACYHNILGGLNFRPHESHSGGHFYTQY